ncbi:MAG TPA: ketoacyl-ACP synthase III [Candidatus Sulfotelmatobacter sp.]|nr:ketoacyl-ACP synthase III [Candidatus Sulfotelmatobacter sp.]
MPRYANIVSTGSYLPEIEISNDQLRRRLAHIPDYVDKMEVATGILKRWHAPDDWATSDLAVRAARQALERANRKPEDVDLIILGTDSPDFITPATSVVLQDKLGAKNAGTFDVACACASFPTGLAAAAGLIATNASLRTVLVIGAYMMHRLADPKDPAIFFYGDGAGAAVLEASDRPGFISSAMHADGSYHRYWGIYAGGTAEPASEAAVRDGRTRVQLVKRYPPEINEQGWPRIVQRLMNDGGFAISDVDLFIFTQVRKPTIESVMVGLGAPVERAHTIMEEQGYTGSACVGMALHDAIEKRKIRAGGLVLMVGSGVGYNQAGVAFRMP